METLRALLTEKDAEYAQMCQQFEENLRSKNQQIRSLESHLSRLQTESTVKSDQINNLKLTVSNCLLVVIPYCYDVWMEIITGISLFVVAYMPKLNI